MQRQVPSTAAVHQHGRHHPFRGAEAYPHDQAVQQTIEIPVAVFKVVDVPVALVVLVVHIPVVAQRRLLMVQTFRRTKKLPQLLDMVIDVPVYWCVDFPSRGAEADSHGLAVQQTIETQLCVDKGGRCPICRSCMSSFSCRDAEADPHGLVDHGGSPVLHWQGDRCPSCWSSDFQCRVLTASCSMKLALSCW